VMPLQPADRDETRQLSSFPGDRPTSTHFSDWSEPVNLGPVVNSAFPDQNPTLSRDGMSLYFASNRPGGVGGIDIWVAQRACVDCPWETPVNLGLLVNSTANDNGPELSADGHLLFFFSLRQGGEGGADLYMSRRTDPQDDFAWEVPVNLGPVVNTSMDEAGPNYTAIVENGTANLYFNRGVQGGPGVTGNTDIYRVRVARDGEILDIPEPVAELNVTDFLDQGPSVRTDGREILFQSDRPGTLGFGDLWVSTRPSAHHSWSIPVNLGAPLSSQDNEQGPDLSHDGRTIVWASGRAGGSGQFDIWMSMRTPGKD
jgi:Tol biopolymer transport system component